MMNAIMQFLGARDLLVFAQVCARTRGYSRICAVLHDAMKGGARAAQINGWINCTRCMIPLCESCELSVDTLMERVMVYADIDGGVPALSDFAREFRPFRDHDYRCTLDTGFHIRGEFPCNYHDMTHDASLDTACAMIISGDATRAHFAYIDKIVAEPEGAGRCVFALFAALRDVHAGSKVTEFFECLCDGQEARAMQHLPFAPATMRAMFGSTRDVIDLFGEDVETHVKIGPNLARCLLDSGNVLSIIAQVRANSREFARCCDICVNRMKESDAAYGSNERFANSMIVRAAKNEDERVFDSMLAIIADTKYASREYNIEWEPSEGFATLSRAILRLESRGMIANVAVPDFTWYNFASTEEAARCFEMILARLDRVIPSHRAVELYGIDVLRVYYLAARGDTARLRKLRELAWHQYGPAIDEYCARMMR